MKILCIGEALIDMICTDTGSSLAHGEHFLKKPGGAPTNVAAAISALGGDVLLAAKVGDDPFGQQLIDTMKEFGVSTSLMIKDKEHFTTFAFVSLMKDGERDFFFNRGADGQLSENDLKGMNLDECAIVHFGSATAFLTGPLQEAYKNLLQKALDKNLFVSFDPNHRQLLWQENIELFIEQSWHFIEHCRFFKLSEEEACIVTRRNSIPDAIEVLKERTQATFAITLGKKGTLLVHEKNSSTIGSISVEAVDSTGAGDAFVGAVLYQLGNLSLEKIDLLNTDDWKQIIANANKAGARTCEYIGAMEAFRHLSASIFE